MTKFTTDRAQRRTPLGDPLLNALGRIDRDGTSEAADAPPGAALAKIRSILGAELAEAIRLCPFRSVVSLVWPARFVRHVWLIGPSLGLPTPNRLESMIAAIAALEGVLVLTPDRTTRDWARTALLARTLRDQSHDGRELANQLAAATHHTVVSPRESARIGEIVTVPPDGMGRVPSEIIGDVTAAFARGSAVLLISNDLTSLAEAKRFFTVLLPAEGLPS